jgi:hypothetical protein
MRFADNLMEGLSSKKALLVPGSMNTIQPSQRIFKRSKPKTQVSPAGSLATGEKRHLLITTCNANLAGGHHEKLAALEIVSVLREHGIELIELGLKLSSWEPKENDASVG